MVRTVPPLTKNEEVFCNKIASRLARMRAHVNAKPLVAPIDPGKWYEILAGLRLIQGNLSNDVSFIASLLAKEFLVKAHRVSFCAAEKPRGAAGLDIDVRTQRGSRIVAEVKTTVPYQAKDFGAQQAAMFRKDFAKLAAAKARHKYLFVTDRRSFNFLRNPKYKKHMSGVRVVLLPTGEGYDA
jgi:hypothetical protein